MQKLRTIFWLVCVLLFAMSVLVACGSSEPEDVKPTAANSKPFPGMAEAKGKGTLALPRDRGQTGEK
jgi:hypothetical protein